MNLFYSIREYRYGFTYYKYVFTRKYKNVYTFLYIFIYNIQNNTHIISIENKDLIRNNLDSRVTT